MGTFQDEITLIGLQLTEIQTAITFILIGGQSYSISSGSTSRTVTQADLKTLITEKNNLQNRLNELQSNAGLSLGAGW
jgi:hypothetical protein